MKNESLKLVRLEEKDGESTIYQKNQISVLPGTTPVKQQIRNIRADKIPASEKRGLIASTCREHLEKYALLAIDSRTPGSRGLICLRSGDIYPISRKSARLDAFLFENYGINSESTEYKFLLAVLTHACFTNLETAIYNHFHFESETGTLFFPLNKREIVSCTEKISERIPNGADGLLIKPSAVFSDFNYSPGKIKVPEQAYVSKYLFRDLNCESNFRWRLHQEEAAFLLEILFYFIPFADSMPTRPILIVHGPKGSGKSSLLKQMGIALFGPKFSLSLIPRSRRELETEFSSNAFCCFDNVDRDLKKSLRDALAAISTGSGFRTRKLYSDATQISYTPRPVIALTTRNPAFSPDDDDIVNRSIILNLKTLQNVIPENELLAQVEKNRDVILTELINKMPTVLSALKKESPVMPNNSFRMADFANFAYKSATPIFIGRMTEDKIQAMLDEVFLKISASQRAYLTADPLHHVVDEFVAQNKKTLPPNKWPIKKLSGALFKELLAIDKSCNFGFAKTCKNLISFGKFMGNNEDIFAERYGYSRKKTTANKTEHSFTGMHSGPLEI
ncbi:MAG: hypothetical protein HN416_13010 [Nitrospina sp.]|nr:hypothetical protein [Nitrospina sp.]